MQIPIFRGGCCMKKVKLCDLGKIITGNTPSKKILEFYDSNDIPFIKPDDFKTIDEISSSKGNKNYISENARNNARIAPKNSVLVTCIGIIGKVMISESELSFNQQINAIVPNKLILSKYLAYLLLYNKSKLDFISNAPVVPIINKTQFSEFEVTFHEDIDVQEKIIQNLENLDNQILKRRHQSKLLSNLVKSRFNEMFDENKRFESLDNLFDIIDGDRGKNYPKSDELFDEEYCLFLNTKNVTKNGFSFNIKQFITEKKDKLLRKGKLERHDIVLTTRGTVGNVAYYDESINYDHLRINSGMVILRAKKTELNRQFILHVLKDDNYYKRLISGSAQPQLPITKIKKILLPLPPLALQNEFADFVAQVDKSQLAIQKSLDELETLKKSLMQKYFG